MATKLYSMQDTTFFADSARTLAHAGADRLAIEEPLEIRLEYWADGQPHRKSISITMRTPGHDPELAAGFLFTEGIITEWNDIKQIRSCGPFVEGQDFQNIMRVKLHSTVPVKTATMDRNFYTTSSCGICGKTSIEALKINNPFGQNIKILTSPSVTQDMLFCLPERMAGQQQLFKETGGCHASALFDEKGALLCLREDVGRHNALDKVLGWALMNNHLPLHHHMVLVSGRASFELMQKSAMGGIPLVAAVGAPSTLAVQMAQEFNMTLVGFLDHQRMTVYHDSGRIQTHQAPQPEDTGGRTTRHTGSPVNPDVEHPDRRWPRP
ncbi:formate dehydrogenase accessory sulfurtransferase FdhD [Candidatus Nitrospira allomarina]|uniref:Sulfur carrier protein FdhD n=1 Tax=Candidatus Nitrospira allomarina TaxID=3020900 RepID=A0AA96G9I1_9BACT|nr:formate dehydrogenase accessory sulfurtransferase FdhD [Candidatus Nitrospira allomarina]WNM57638.1 formate dehydrogenase accessory sulfurtransferase FdhD [Candidatus Nitrospira allomarina]